MTEKSSCVTRVPASTCCSSSWDVTAADPVPEAVRANVLPWTRSAHQGLGAAACWPNWFVWEQPEAESSPRPQLSASTLSRGCLQSQSIRLWVASSLTSSVRCVFSTPRLSAQGRSRGRQWGHVVQEPTHLSRQWTTHNFPGCSAWSHQSDAWEWLLIFSFYFLRGHAVVPKHLISQNSFLSWWLLQGNQQSEVNSQKVSRSFLG